VSFKAVCLRISEHLMLALTLPGYKTGDDEHLAGNIASLNLNN
jgi:hypothetical protein